MVNANVTEPAPAVVYIRWRVPGPVAVTVTPKEFTTEGCDVIVNTLAARLSHDEFAVTNARLVASSVRVYLPAPPPVGEGMVLYAVQGLLE